MWHMLSLMTIDGELMDNRLATAHGCSQQLQLIGHTCQLHSMQFHMMSGAKMENREEKWGKRKQGENRKKRWEMKHGRKRAESRER